MRNLPEWVIAFWAAIAAGAVVVPINAWWTGPELAYGLSDSGTSVVFVDQERRERILPHLDEIPSLTTMVVCCEEPDPDGGRRTAEGGSVARTGCRRPCPSSRSPTWSTGLPDQVGLPDVGHRSRRRRHHLLHVGDHRPARRVPSAPIATAPPT